jgi:hypothetical protein
VSEMLAVERFVRIKSMRSNRDGELFDVTRKARWRGGWLTLKAMRCLACLPRGMRLCFAKRD